MCSLAKSSWLMLSACLFITCNAQAERLAIFGDSLSDTGNRYAVNGILNEPPYDGLNAGAVPVDPYPFNGAHFSNGWIWVERVAVALGSPLSARAVDSGGLLAANYAFGGARAYPPEIDNGARHLSAQVSSYLADVNNRVSPRTLHVIFIGGNDMVDALLMLGAGRPFPDAVTRIAMAAAAIQESVNALVSAGARRFLILNAPDIGLVPAIGDSGRPLLSCFARLLNQGGDLPQGCPALSIPVNIAGIANALVQTGAEVTLVDTFAFIDAVAQAGPALGFDNVNTSCVSPRVEPYVCSSPNSYLFWDGLHPSQAVHRLLAGVVLNKLGR